MSRQKDANPGGFIKVSDTPRFRQLQKQIGKIPDQKWLDAVVAFSAQNSGDEELAFMPGQLVQCTFPHDNPGNIPEYVRTTPWLTVSIRPGYKTDRKTGQRVCIGYPYGTVPRLLMFYITGELERMKNRADLTPEEKRRVYFGSSFAAFLRLMGMNPDNGSGKRSDRRRCENQVERTVRSIISFDHIDVQKNVTREPWANMPVSSYGEFFWDVKEPKQDSLWESFIVVSEVLYQAVMSSSVPLDYIAIRALKDSALHLDLYAWCRYRAHLLSRGNKTPLIVPWRSFMMQLGTSYTRSRDFRARVIEEFPTVAPFLKGLAEVKFSKIGIEVRSLEDPITHLGTRLLPTA
jgi:hypothetical protein